jgi:hypothetical protein
MATKKADTSATPTDMVTISRADLAAMIAEALQAREDEKPMAPPPGMELAQAIGDAVALGLEKNNPKKVTFGQYLKRGTKNHPLGLASPKFSRQYFQNGHEVPYDAVPDEDVLLLNSLTHSGRYLDRKVEVILRDTGGDTQSLEFRYRNGSIDDRMDLKGLFKSFHDLVYQIAAAQAEERREDEETPKRVVRRPFGNGKNTRAAEDAAGV